MTVSSLRIWMVVSLVLVCAFSACKESPQTGGGSETHWLKRCNSDDDCGGDTHCECGICTQACESAQACSDVPGAASCILTESLDNGSCRIVDGTEADKGICVAGCREYRDCNDGVDFECIKGICVAIIEKPGSSDGSTEVGYGLVFAEADSALTEIPDGSVPDDAEASSNDEDAGITNRDADNGSNLGEGGGDTADANAGPDVPLGPVSEDTFPQCPCTVDLEEGVRAPKIGDVPDNAYGGPETLSSQRIDTILSGGLCPGDLMMSMGERFYPMVPDSDSPSYEGLEDLCYSYMLCAYACSIDDDCPAVDTGTAVPRCSAASKCYLQCDAGRRCPDGMICISGADGSTCLWWEDEDIQGCPAFCERDPIPRECPNFCAAQLVACNPDKGVDCCEGLVCSSEGYCVQV